MIHLHATLRRITGWGTPFPASPLVFFTAAFLALLQIPLSLIIHHVNLALGLVLNEIVIVVGVPLFLTWRLRFDAEKLYPLSRPRASTWLPLIVLLLGAVIVIDYLTFASELIVPLPQKYQDALNRIMAVSTGTQFAYKLILLCLLPGVCEEIFFRGFCQTALTHYKGDTFAIIVTGALFALLHANPWQMHLYFILGCFLSWIFAVTRTLWVPIVCHILNNAWTLTNHTLETTPPIEGQPVTTNVLILVAGVVFAIVGGMWFLRSQKTVR